MLEAHLTFKAVIRTFIWTIKNAKRNSHKEIESPIIFIEQPKSQWRVGLRHLEENNQVAIYARIESTLHHSAPEMTFQIGIGDQFFDETYGPIKNRLPKIFLRLTDPRIANDDWTICCKLNLMINTCLPDDTIPIQLKQRATTVLTSSTF